MGVIHWYSNTHSMGVTANGGYSLVFWYPNQWELFIGTLIPSQWGLFIGTLIPKPVGVVHWYSNTQTNGGCSLVLWYPANRGYSLVLWYPNNGSYSLVLWYPANGGLFIGTLIPSQWGLFIGILIPKPMRVIHWYSDAQSRGYSVTIVIRLLRIWTTFEYLNHFESLKLHMWFWKCLSIWTILSHLNCLCIFGTYCKL